MYKTKITITKTQWIGNYDLIQLKTWNYKQNFAKAETAWDKLKVKYKIDDSKLIREKSRDIFCSGERFETPRGLTYYFTCDNNAIY